MPPPPPALSLSGSSALLWWMDLYQHLSVCSSCSALLLGQHFCWQHNLKSLIEEAWPSADATCNEWAPVFWPESESALIKLKRHLCMPRFAIRGIYTSSIAPAVQSNLFQITGVVGWLLPLASHPWAWHATSKFSADLDEAAAAAAATAEAAGDPEASTLLRKSSTAGAFVADLLMPETSDCTDDRWGANCPHAPLHSTLFRAFQNSRTAVCSHHSVRYYCQISTWPSRQIHLPVFRSQTFLVLPGAGLGLASVSVPDDLMGLLL